MLSGCGEETIKKPYPPEPLQPLATTSSPEHKEIKDSCKIWEKNKDGSEVCKDSNSSMNGSSFFNGMLFGSMLNMNNSSDYKNNNLVNGTNVVSYRNANNKYQEQLKSYNEQQAKRASVRANKKGASSNNNSKATTKGGSNGGAKSGFGSGARGGGAS